MNSSFSYQRVQHVSVPRPNTGESIAVARRFYGEVLGLREINPPSSLAGMNLIWFKAGDDELHVFPSDEVGKDVGQHLCLQVDNIDALRLHLEAHDVAIEDTVAIPNRPRFFCADPFGNRIECTAILGAFD
jgi:catechol 2,3-dioxygenase-like lactoylglutathione lyase family enzyme